jgi:hypothetical protein
MDDHRNPTSVESTVSAAILGQAEATPPPQDGLVVASLPRQRRGATGFTLIELLVTIGVLVLVVLLASQLLNSAASITTLGHKQMDADSQARQLLDRMAIDFAQMIKRSDVDYYLKSSATGTGVRNLLQPGNDKIAFYSAVPGYYPSGGSLSPMSLVSYRVNAQHKLERMGKGLLWNASTPTSGATPPAFVFMPVPLASPIPLGELPSPTPNPLPTPAWPNVDNLSVSPTPDPNTEVVGSQVFRFEYYYLVSGQVPAGALPLPAPSPSPPILCDIPWDWRLCFCPPSPTPTATPTPTITPPALCCHTAPEGMQDVAAVVVTIAVIDSKSRALVTDAQLARLNGADGQAQGPGLIDWGRTGVGYPTQAQWQTTPGLLMAQWRAVLDANAIGLPPPVISGIRLYERYLYLSRPNLQTP